MEIENLKTALNESRVRVEFTKIDGSSRSMLCTWNSADVPSSKSPSGKKKTNDSVLSVFDLEKQGWRRIKIENIRSWVVDSM